MDEAIRFFAYPYTDLSVPDHKGSASQSMAKFIRLYGYT